MRTIKTKRGSETIIQYLAFFLLLFAPYNNTIIHLLPLGTKLMIVLPIVAIILFVFIKKEKQSKKDLLLSLALLLLSSYLLFSNKHFDIENNVIFYSFQIITILSFIILSKRKIDSEILYKTIIFFTIEHIIGTMFEAIAPNVYSNNVLPIICKGNAECEAYRNFKQGLNSGFTSHFTINAIYISIGMLATFFKAVTTKNKKSIILFAIATIALLIIGKRAHFVFSLFSIVITYLYCGKNNLNTRVKNALLISVLAIGSIILLSIASNYIPNLNTTVSRIRNTTNTSESLLNGRDDLYNLAFEEWKKAPYIGNGWGSYTIVSNEKFGKWKYGHSYMHTHNDYLEVLSDTGLIGLSVYIIILISVFMTIKKNSTASKNIKWINYYSFSFMVFFVLYSLTGTPISFPITLSLLVLVASINYLEGNHA